MAEIPQLARLGLWAMLHQQRNISQDFGYLARKTFSSAE
jgi:hypothetical protein